MTARRVQLRRCLHLAACLKDGPKSYRALVRMVERSVRTTYRDLDCLETTGWVRRSRRPGYWQLTGRMVV